MKIFTAIILLTVLASCSHTPAPADQTTMMPPAESVAPKMDTLVAKKDVTAVIPGSEYIKKAYSYVLINGADTSPFKCHFSQWKADSSLFFVSKFTPVMSYEQQMNELVRITAEADRDFNLTTLKTIGIGRLISTGDLAVKISKTYEQRYGKGGRISINIDTFLLHSTMTQNFNRLLSPYGIEVKEVVTEKKIFLPSAQLPLYSKIESPSAFIPENILDCITYLKVGKI